MAEQRFVLGVIQQQMAILGAYALLEFDSL